MSEHPLDREMRLLIDSNHRLTEVLVGMANVVSDTRRLHEELDLEGQLTALLRSQQGGPLNGQPASVAGNGAYASAEAMGWGITPKLMGRLQPSGLLHPQGSPGQCLA
jgi:hypothetical protein